MAYTGRFCAPKSEDKSPVSSEVLAKAKVTIEAILEKVKNGEDLETKEEMVAKILLHKLYFRKALGGTSTKSIKEIEKALNCDERIAERIGITKEELAAIGRIAIEKDKSFKLDETIDILEEADL